MALIDKVKAQASQLAQKAQEAGKVGQAKIEDVQARRRADALYRSLGAAYYAQRSGDASSDVASTIERLVTEIKAHHDHYGAAGTDDLDDSSSGDESD